MVIGNRVSILKKNEKYGGRDGKIIGKEEDVYIILLSNGQKVKIKTNHVVDHDFLKDIFYIEKDD